MAVTTPGRPASGYGGAASPDGARAGWRDPGLQAFALLRTAFVAAPIAFGLDKFLNVMVDWPIYLALLIGALALARLAAIHDRPRAR